MLMLFIISSCNSLMKNDFENEAVDKLGKANHKRLSVSDPWDTIPSPISWISNVEGTGPYQPSDADYFYVGPEPDSKSENLYNNYAHFYWNAFPLDSSDLATSYKMQIQWRFGFNNWNYINTPNGLINIRDIAHLEDMSAFLFPYSTEQSKLITLRMRIIHEDFLTSIPDLQSDYMYDRSLVSPWNYGEDSWYYNPWGYGQPQPQIKPDGNWSTLPELESGGPILVTVYMPTTSGYTFSYNVVNFTGGSIQSYNTNPNFMGIGKNALMGVGLNGGTLHIAARCRNTQTNDYTDTMKIVTYYNGQTTLEVFFDEHDFDISP